MKRIVVVLCIVLLLKPDLLQVQLQYFRPVIQSRSLVSAQATGFCHRPNIKPNFVNLDSNVNRNSDTTHTNNNDDVFVIAHRGASYHIPIEHSIASYRLALELGAHFIESDIAISQDGILFPMHSMDLTITTNILSSSLVTVDQRQSWFSRYANRSSFWSFNFTFAELQTLTLQQRKADTSSSNEASPQPPQRTDLYNNLFKIPTLDDVVHLLVDWNINEIPKLHSNISISTETMENIEPTDPMAASHLPNYYYDRYKAGLYLEFKNSDWILAETGYNVVELVFTQITQRLLGQGVPPPTNHDAITATRYSWKDLFTCYERIRFDEYIVPPLILQSFNHSDLLLFHNLWHQYQITNFADPSTTTNQLSTLAPEPLYVVLVDAPKCYDDSFWYIMSNDQYRSLINGIGCHKNCLLPISASSSTTGNDTSSSKTTLSEQEMIEEQHEHIEAIMERITELQMVLHVWTERPEISYLSNYPMFRTVMDEMYYLKCNVSHVHGIFTESVDMAIRTLQIPCPILSSSTTSTSTNANYGSSPQTAICNDNNNSDKSHISILGVVVSFIFGMIVTLLMNRFGHFNRCTRCCRSDNLSSSTVTNHNSHKNAYQHATTIITSNDDDVDDDNYNKNGFRDDQTNNGLELSIS